MGDHKHKSKDKSKSSKKDRKEHHHHRKHKKSSSSRQEANLNDNSNESMDIDYSDPSLWVEKADHDNMATPATIEQPTSVPQQQQNARHDWMLDSSFDFGDFGSKKPEPKEEDKPNPDQVS